MEYPRKISIVSPVYNEESGIIKLIDAIETELKQINYDYEIILVDDGSADGSLDEMKKASKNNEKVFYVELSRNFGHQQALKAGLDLATGDAVISMDADLQHPPKLIKDLIFEWENGSDIVYTIRESTEKASAFKKWSSSTYYKGLNKISGIPMEPGAADFRLLDRSVLNVLSNINESDLFIRGIINWIGFKTKAIHFVAGERVDGESKYTFRKMFQLAVHGILSTTTRPLNFAMYLGISLSMLCLLYIPYVIISYLNGSAVSGWISIVVTVSFLGGIQLFILGIIGLYLGKLYLQSKGRPGYIIRDSNYQSLQRELKTSWVKKRKYY